MIFLLQTPIVINNYCLLPCIWKGFRHRVELGLPSYEDEAMTNRTRALPPTVDFPHKIFSLGISCPAMRMRRRLTGRVHCHLQLIFCIKFSVRVSAAQLRGWRDDRPDVCIATCSWFSALNFQLGYQLPSYEDEETTERTAVVDPDPDTLLTLRQIRQR